MRNIIVSTGSWIWQKIPLQPLRQKIWDVFLWAVRGLKTNVEIDGIRYDLDLGETIDVCIYLRRFEKEVTDQIEAICQEGWVILDVGANIGAHCLRFARIVGESGKVYAFEPTDFAFAKLQRNLSLNHFPQVTSYHAALSNENATGKTITCRSSWKTDGTQTVESGTVDFIRLDDWAQKEGVERLDLIKIDVDGNEFSVIDGGRKLIETFRPVFIAEVGAWHFAHADQNPWQILSDMGYTFYNMKNGQPYPDLNAIRQRLPQEDEIMGLSLNVIIR